MNQWIIALTGFCVIPMLVRPVLRWRRWTLQTRPWVYLIGLLGQSAWIFESLQHAQWGTLALSIWWTYWYGDALWRYYNPRRAQDGRTCR